MSVNLSQSPIKEVLKFRDEELTTSLRKTAKVLKTAVVDGYNHWIIAFSGGKDSSPVTVLIVELLRDQSIKKYRS